MNEMHITAAHACVDMGIDKAVHKKNYHLLIIFHSDLEKRPCRPVLQVVHLPYPPETLSSGIHANPKGVEILTTCQLCDPSTNSPTSFRVDLQKILCVCSVGITDTEASRLINNVSKINNHVARDSVTLTHRSNFAFVPRWTHKFLKIGKFSLNSLDNMSSATDVHVAILLILESIDKARSLWVDVQALHRAMSTPENLFDSLSSFTRNLDTKTFKVGAFKYISDYD
jgi:hypothetical protein